MRTSIRKHNQDFLRELAKQWGMKDTSEVVNQLIFLARTGGNLPEVSHQTTSLGFSTPIEQPQTIINKQSNMGLESFPYNQGLAQEIDPIIERLAGLIENF